MYCIFILHKFFVENMVHASLINLHWQFLQTFHRHLQLGGNSFHKPRPAVLSKGTAALWSIWERKFQHVMLSTVEKLSCQLNLPLIIYRKELYNIFDLWSWLNIPNAGPDGGVCVSCCLASDIRCMWLPMRISQMLVCKQWSHQKLRIVLEFEEIEWNTFCCGSYMHAI